VNLCATGSLPATRAAWQIPTFSPVATFSQPSGTIPYDNLAAWCPLSLGFFQKGQIVAKSNKDQVQMDRRAREERRKQAVPVVVERRKVQRRRQIDPTTCERDYSADEIEFMQALDAYKRANGRMFPTCSEILEVIRNLGYVRIQPGEQLAPAQVNAQAPFTAAEAALS
jgi:hypothetical protein